MSVALKRALMLVMLFATGCGSASYSAPMAPYDVRNDAESYGEVVTTASRGGAGLSRRLEQSYEDAYSAGAAPAPVVAYAQAAGDLAAPQAFDPAPDPEPSREGPLLIYNARMTLAIYQVDAVQAQALAVAESVGGWVAERSRYAMVLRVPAEDFRDVLASLQALGDVLALDWDASDVSEAFTDLEIRLRNSLQMRDRLESLLERAQTVEEALAIETELERVTLEIERMRGQLRVLVDRIAFSTITLSFQELRSTDVPTEEYRLPFPWLNQLGLERLLTY